ncbi:hypothetical protein NON00_24140, partial [Roseomonas sp. GC11]|uniref:hypothetical protein n=1 Tax=Roseomonas sp. GC11 TaxID=2950546 RepID=UPI00210D8198
MARPAPKLLTPLTLGAVHLAHRAVVLARGGLPVPAVGRLATRGGLVIQRPAASWAESRAGWA